MILVTDEFGMITGVEPIPDKYFEITNNPEWLVPYRLVLEGRGNIGTQGLCYSNHVHPYSDEWQYDSTWIQINRKVEEIANSITMRIRQGIYDLTLFLVDVSVAITKIYFILLSKFADALPGLIDIFIMMLDAIKTLGGEKLKDENGNEHDIDDMINELNKK